MDFITIHIMKPKTISIVGLALSILAPLSLVCLYIIGSKFPTIDFAKRVFNILYFTFIISVIISVVISTIQLSVPKWRNLPMNLFTLAIAGFVVVFTGVFLILFSGMC